MPARKPTPARPGASASRRSTAAPPPQPSSSARPRGATALLFLALLVVYMANLRVHGAGDSIPTRLLPFSILRQGNVDLDEFSWERTPAGRLPYYVAQVGGHVYSTTTIATSLVVTPLYVVPAWLLSARHVSYDDVRAQVAIFVMERFSAALLTALSGALLFAALCRLVAWRGALALALVYALGTSTWSISSQALWTHALSELTLAVLCVVFLAPKPSRGMIALAGAAAAVEVANRPQMIMFAGLAFLFVCLHHRRHVVAFAAMPAIAGAALLIYNLNVFRGIAGGYGGFDHFHTPVLTGLAGLLVSPNRGLFVFTPIAIFALWGAVRAWRPEVPAWMRFLVVGIVLHTLLYAKFDEWWAGYTFGPRYMTDVLPAIVLLIACGLQPIVRKRAMLALAGVLALYGVAVQVIGVYFADDDWNRGPVPLEAAPQRVWDWSDLQIVRAARSGWHGSDLEGVLIGSLGESQPVLLAALSQDDLATRFEISDRPAEMAAGSTLTPVVRLTNRGTRAWPAFSGKGRISIRYLTVLVVRWFAGDRTVAGSGDVLRLRENLMPGETLKMPVPLAAPRVPGSYEVELRIAQAIDGRHGIVSRDALRLSVTVK
jgi:hypothetical protein